MSIKSPNTGATVAAQIVPRQLWKKAVDVFEQSNDFFMPMEGGDKHSIIPTITDTSKGVGQKIIINSMSGLYAEPHIGEELFEHADDYERLLFGEYELAVDFLRHAVRYTVRTEEAAGLRGEIASRVPDELGKWLGRIKTELLFMTFLHKLNSENVVFAGAKNLDTLTSNDVLKWDEVIAANAQLGRLGGTPARVSKKGEATIRAGVLVASNDALFSLKTDSLYRQILRETRVVEAAKLIFDGGYPGVDGNVIAPYNPIDHDGAGAIGSPINAKAYLGQAIAAGTTAIDVLGGGSATAAALAGTDEVAKRASAKLAFFKFFPNYAYRFNPFTSLALDADTHYFLIVNPPNATDAEGGANKIGMYAYTTGNNGNKIAITGRLAAAVGGIAATTLGGVTWNTGVWEGKHTDKHPVGSLILPCTKNGVVFGDSLFLYSKAAYRGYGMWRNKRTEQSLDGEFIKAVYINSVFGQSVVRDRAGRCPGVLRLRHALKYAGVPVPDVTSV